MSKLKGVVAHHKAKVAERCADLELAVEHFKASMESLDNPDDRAAGLLERRTLTETYLVLGTVANKSGFSRELLYAQSQPDAENAASRAKYGRHSTVNRT